VQQSVLAGDQELLRLVTGPYFARFKPRPIAR
jgi:hypothetical protein